MKVKLKSDIYVGDKHYAAREGKAPRYGPQIVHDLKEEVAKGLIERGDATPVRESTRKAVAEPPARATAEAKDRTAPKAPE